MYMCSFGRMITRLGQQPVLSTVRTMAASVSKQNRLAEERSPYLLQHASNPVDWYPWGEEAFKAAREQNKLIFLSVGYSTCHWCHVMERESFNNEDIAKIMNANFINIKVDREERPDVDKVYMTFVTASSGRGGWPMSVFLTPDLKPVAGGTYFPPTDSFGRVGFSTMLKALASKWRDERKKFEESSVKIMEVLNRTAKLTRDAAEHLPGEETFAKCFSQLSRSYEPQYGGFSESPKFPQPSNLNFLFTYHFLNPDLDDAKAGSDMALHTLAMMNKGGIHDHVAQGFARYSTDEKWHVPHFEKMLYDQAQLVHAYLDAYQITKEALYEEVVKDILTYVLRDLSHQAGGFFSAEDADSYPTSESEEKKEGAFCVWTHEEIQEILSDPIKPESDVTRAQLFCHHFSVVEGGNVNPYQDPHDELKNQNVLIIHGNKEETGCEFGLNETEVDTILKECLTKLFEVRRSRPRPHLDDKMITAWNGMMISALSRAGVVLQEPSYLEHAIQGANFVQKYLYSDGVLLRAAYTTEDGGVSLGSKITGFLDDHAWIIRAFLYLYDATLDSEWLRLADELQQKQDSLFWDSKSGGYFMTQTGDESILLRMKEDQDGAEPSANSVSAGNLVHLASLLDSSDYRTKAEFIFKLFSDRLTKIPIALPEMVRALLLHKTPAKQIILSGEKDAEDTKKLLRMVHSIYLPHKNFLLADADSSSFLYGRLENLKKYTPKSPKSKAYVCHNFVCSLPISCPEKLKEILQSATPGM
ncbi:spermatogenesis-associated protein 20 [Oratosquilla oratoria]|uniref:spermatogenesis-associated protein 20 n=1 Tax=Oratosquilla oratoria TaxID=337810 RepID=UPI003F7662B9